MTRRLLGLLVLSMVVVATVPAPVAAAEDPRFETTVPAPRLTAGAEQSVTVHLLNDAEDVDDRVKTATNVQVEAVAGETPFEVISGPQRVGTLPDGVPTPVTVTIAVPADAAAGTYRLPLQVTYEFDGDERETTTVFARVIVPEQPVFAVTAVDSAVALEEHGTVTVTMRNDGSATAYDATVTLTTQNAALLVEGSQTATQYAGVWAPNETRTFTVHVAATDAATVREYALTLTPTYEDDDGIHRRASSLAIGVTPAPKQTFSMRDVSIVHHSETAATLSGTVTNTGVWPVRNAQVTLRSDSPGVTVVEPTAAAGSLDAGESADVSFELRVSPEAVPGERQFSATVQYGRSDGRTYRSDAISVTHGVNPGTDVLAFEPVNNTFAVDDTNRFVVRVTNTGEETLDDLHARLLVHPPYESAAPTSYVESLAPGDSATLTFEVTTPSDAVATKDALPIVVNATAPGNREISAGPTLVPFVLSTESGPTGSTTNLIIGVVVVAVVLAAGWWWLNR
ncbi:MAG: COG1361 S-layer family protein [Halanaeroarchaeum sp.]